MARVVFGRLLAVFAFGCALFLAAVWVTQDRPTAWLARLAGDEPRAAEHRVTIPAAAETPPAPAAPPAASRPAPATCRTTAQVTVVPLPARTARLPVPSVVGAP